MVSIADQTDSDTLSNILISCFTISGYMPVDFTTAAATDDASDPLMIALHTW